MDDVLDRHRAIDRPVLANVLGHAFEVRPGVFSPLIAPSGVLEMAFAVWPIFRGRRVVDVGSGSGISTCLFALGGARHVLGIDINPDAVASGVANAQRVGVESRVEFRCGDVLEPVAFSEPFDLLFANLPLMAGDPRDSLERAFFDPGLGSTKRFLRQAAERMREYPGTEAYLCTSDLDSTDLQTEAMRLSLAWAPAMTIPLGWVSLSLVRLHNARE